MSKRKKVCEYNGFSIIRVDVRNYFYYEFCKVGDEKSPSKAYNILTDTIVECKGYIDNFIKDDTFFFTQGEYHKYVSAPNKKCGWRYGYESLMRIMRQHQKADKRIKYLLQERLTDANFHSESGLLSNEDYDGFVELVTKTYKFLEKFEVITETEKARIKNPKQFTEGLSKVISEYFASQGVKATTAKVKFIENW